MPEPGVIVVGAGIGGLAAAADLARNGLGVLVLDAASGPGGKLIPLRLGDVLLDTGPTVFTMKWVFESLFRDGGTALDDALTCRPLEVLARHAWNDGSRLDLFADKARSRDAIAEFAGAREARGFIEFCERARNIYQTLETPFIRSEQPTPLSLARGAGISGLGDLWRISPFSTLWRALSGHFRDPRLRQLFARYATYSGSSPFLSPATLMLIADVEQQGVWSIDDGMYRLAEAVESLARRHGAEFRYQAPVRRIVVTRGHVAGVELEDGERIDCTSVIFNGDAAALAAGLLGSDVQRAIEGKSPTTRSLSAVTWSLLATASGFPLSRHNIFFSSDYAREFDTILERRQLPDDPTIYVCAQDRGHGADDKARGARLGTADGAERFLCLINAPADGDRRSFGVEEIAQCQSRVVSRLQAAGLHLTAPAEMIHVRTPATFARMFPATGGALYGQASHGWTTSFSRPSATTRIAGLYLAGGSVHPGAGVPMAALSGRIAARRLLAERTSRSP